MDPTSNENIKNESVSQFNDFIESMIFNYENQNKRDMSRFIELCLYDLIPLQHNIYERELKMNHQDMDAWMENIFQEYIQSIQEKYVSDSSTNRYIKIITNIMEMVKKRFEESKECMKRVHTVFIENKLESNFTFQRRNKAKEYLIQEHSILHFGESKNGRYELAETFLRYIFGIIYSSPIRGNKHRDISISLPSTFYELFSFELPIDEEGVVDYDSPNLLLKYWIFYIYFISKLFSSSSKVFNLDYSNFLSSIKSLSELEKDAKPKENKKKGGGNGKNQKKENQKKTEKNKQKNKIKNEKKDIVQVMSSIVFTKDTLYNRMLRSFQSYTRIYFMKIIREITTETSQTIPLQTKFSHPFSNHPSHKISFAELLSTDHKKKTYSPTHPNELLNVLRFDIFQTLKVVECLSYQNEKEIMLIHKQIKEKYVMLLYSLYFLKSKIYGIFIRLFQDYFGMMIQKRNEKSEKTHSATNSSLETPSSTKNKKEKNIYFYIQNKEKKKQVEEIDAEIENMRKEIAQLNDMNIKEYELKSIDLNRKIRKLLLKKRKCLHDVHPSE